MGPYSLFKAETKTNHSNETQLNQSNETAIFAAIALTAVSQTKASPPGTSMVALSPELKETAPMKPVWRWGDHPLLKIKPVKILLTTQSDVDAFATQYLPSKLILTVSDDNDGNDNIVNLNGPSGLTTIFQLEIEGNPWITDVNGLGNLTKTENDLRIQNNMSLTNLDGLSNFGRVGGDLWIYSFSSSKKKIIPPRSAMATPWFTGGRDGWF
ncbi:MAG: hypothetical protein AAF492_23555 [Verrucomicrobiota bacterium]